MSIEFPLDERLSAFGPVSYPRIPVYVPTLFGEQVLWFLIDTGADFTVAPRDLAEEVGLNWDRLQPARIRGVGQGGVQARLGLLSISIGGISLVVRCLFLDAPNTTLLLGRADFLDRFVLTIDQPRRRIVLDQVES